MTAVNYLWNPITDNIIEEFDDAGTTIAEYTTDPGLHGNVVSQYRDGQESFYCYDGQGSTLALTNASGNIIDTYAYSAFGELTARTGNTVNPFQYIGQKQYYRDQETGDYDVRRRPLSTDKGRWLSLDAWTMSLPTEWLPTIGDLYPYAYAENRPLLKIDPSGLVPVELTYVLCEPNDNFLKSFLPGPILVKDPTLKPCIEVLVDYDKSSCSLKYKGFVKQGIEGKEQTFKTSIKLGFPKTSGGNVTIELVELMGSVKLTWQFQAFPDNKITTEKCTFEDAPYFCEMVNPCPWRAPYPHKDPVRPLTGIRAPNKTIRS